MRCFTAESFEQFIKVELKIDITPWQRDVIKTLDQIGVNRDQYGIVGDAYHGVSEPIPLHNQPCSVAGCYGQDPNCQYRAGEQSKWAFDGGPPLGDLALDQWQHVCTGNRIVTTFGGFNPCPSCGAQKTERADGKELPPLIDPALSRWTHICKENKTVELESYFLRCPNCGTEPK